mmetsp:Transcript_24954/g.28558  ORF Transcript_24954/g.28558 Transcript_24954/m.28558 type:complete len:541 (+) Transcript_24954:424-2046(+)
MLMPAPYASQHNTFMKNFIRKGVSKILGKRGRTLSGLRKDGSTFPMYLTLSETRLTKMEVADSNRLAHTLNYDTDDEDEDEIILFTGIMRDLSAEEEERQLMAAMIESCIDPIFVIDKKGIIERCNAACTKVFGFQTDEMIGNNISMLMPEHVAKNHDQFLENYLKVHKGNDPCKKRCASVVGKGRDVVGQRKDGSFVPLFLSVSEFLQKSNQHHGFIGIMRDMTEKQNAIDAEMERKKSEALLMNLLPRTISDRLKVHGDDHANVQIADAYENVTILFADIVGFTDFCSDRSAMDVVHYLNKIFLKFDKLVDQYDALEKIKTIGDAYMVVGGINNDQDHAIKVLKFALEMLTCIEEFNDAERQNYSNAHQFGIRIGVHIGNVVAGVVGTKRRFFDLWGDAVNVASRMESTGISNCIQSTEVVASLARLHPDLFAVLERGSTEVKGKGYIDTFLISKKGGEKPMEETLRAHNRISRQQSILLHEKLEMELYFPPNLSRKGSLVSINEDKQKSYFRHLFYIVIGIVMGLSLQISNYKALFG